MHIIIKFLNVDGYEVDNERVFFCPIDADSILVSLYASSPSSSSALLIDSCKLEVL